MAWLYHFNQIVTHGMEGFLETAVPLISGLAEIIGLFIIVTSLVKATYHYVRVTFFHGQHDFLHEMSSGLTTALEFLMSAEIAKTFLLQNLESVVPLAGTAPAAKRKKRPPVRLRKRMTYKVSLFFLGSGLCKT